MRYFKFIGTGKHSFYKEGKLITITSGGVVKAPNEMEAFPFERNPKFIECDASGNISRGVLEHPAEKITSRQVYKFNPNERPTLQ